MQQKQLSHYLRTKDFLVSGETFELLYDAGLDLLQTFPQPKPENLSAYYESEEYISHTDSGKGLVAFLYRQIKKYALRKKLRLISRLNSGNGTLADLGAGTGAFLEAATEKGWRVSGVEPSEKARTISNKKGIELKSSIAGLSGEQFDVVTLWHVLEHLTDLESEIKRIKGLVKPGGHLIVAVPNFKSYDARYYGKYWAAFDVPRHLWHFSKKSIRKLFSDQLQLTAVKPMYFDSFYVSLLSEKYKSGKAFSLKAVFIGFWSNLKGIRSKEYSSHIYCFKKPA